MWIVRLALTQPHTFIVMAISIFLFGAVSLSQMPVDIFPTIDVPVVSCVWTYTGMSPKNVEDLVTTVSERIIASTVSNVQRIESMSLNGMSVIKIFLQHGADIGLGVAQTSFGVWCGASKHASRCVASFRFAEFCHGCACVATDSCQQRNE